MKPNPIDPLLKALRPVIKDGKKARQFLEKFFSENLVTIWGTEDIYEAANERGFVLSSAEASELLAKLKAKYTRYTGLRWTDLWELVDDSCFGRKMTKEEENAFVQRNLVKTQKERGN